MAYGRKTANPRASDVHVNTLCCCEQINKQVVKVI